MEVKNRSLSVLQTQITLPLYKMFTYNIYREGLMILSQNMHIRQYAQCIVVYSYCIFLVVTVENRYT